MMFSHTGVTSSAMSEKCDLDFLNNAKAVTKSIHPLYSHIGDVTYQKYRIKNVTDTMQNDSTKLLFLYRYCLGSDGLKMKNTGTVGTY